MAGPIQNYLNNTNSAMTPLAQPVGMRQTGVLAKGPVAQPIKSLSELGFGLGSSEPGPISKLASNTGPARAPVPVKPLQPAVAQPIGPVSQLAMAKPLTAADVDKQVIAPGTGFVTNNSTGNVTGVGSPISALSQQAQPMQVQATQPSQYAGAISQLAREAEQLRGQSGSGVADDGTQLSEGDMAIGRAIASRGLLNQAKAFSQLDAQHSQSATSQQNADANSQNVGSIIQDRVQDNLRKGAESELNVSGAKLTQAQAQRISDLQDQYLKATDPVIKDRLADELASLAGKDKYQPILGKDSLGNSAYMGAFNSRTGKYTGPTIAALSLLKRNPELAGHFKAKYGFLPE